MEVILYQSHALDIQIPPEGWVFDFWGPVIPNLRPSVFADRCPGRDSFNRW